MTDEETYPEPPNQGAMEVGSEIVGSYELTTKGIDKYMPIRKKIGIRLQILRKEVADLEDALKAIDSNPEFEKIHDTLSKISRYL